MKRKESRLTKARVLRKFVEAFGLKLEKVSSIASTGGSAAYWMLVRDRGDEICPLYAPNFGEIYTFGPRTNILDFFLNDIPQWHESWWEKGSDGTLSKRRVEFDNPVFGCGSLEEAMVKLDLLDPEKPKKGKTER